MYSAVSRATDSWSPSPELMEPYNRWVEYHKTALANYYSTAELQTDRDLVRFFHKAWDLPSRVLMCQIVDSQAFESYFLSVRHIQRVEWHKRRFPGRRRTESLRLERSSR